MRSQMSLILFLSTVLYSRALWAGRCDPPARIAEFLRTLPDDNRERHADIERRLASSPDDFWLNRLFLDGSVYERGAIRDKYKARSAVNPGNLDDRYLYGRSLVGFDTKAALRIYTEILNQDPDYPWVHYSQLEIYRAEAFRDRAKLRDSFDTLTRVCPGWIEPYRYLTALDDDALAAHAARFRTILEASEDWIELKLYSTLWSAEFRVRPKSEWDAQKERIAADLKRLREIPGLQTVVVNGATLIGDSTLAKEMTPPRAPDLMSVSQAWYRAHPFPKKDDPPENRTAYAKSLLEASSNWIALEPQRLTGYSERFRALRLLDAPAEQLAQSGDDVLRIARTDDRAFGASFIPSVADVYVERGIRLDRVPAIIEEAMKAFDDPEGVIEIDLAPAPEMTRMNRMDRVSRHVSALATLSKYYEKAADKERARAVLAPIPKYLAEHPVPDDVRDVNAGHNLLLSHAFAEYSYWLRLAELNNLENQKEEALNAYREALMASDGQRDDLLAKQRKLWRDLERSDESWQAWLDSIPPPAWRGRGQAATTEFASTHRALPSIILKDLDGREWPSDRFTVGTTIAVVWATWCGPCVQEMPYFAKLAERFKDRRDVQVVSFNTDENPALVKSFVEKNGYNFPILLAKNFAEDLMPYFSIPRIWIIRKGAVVEESVGFGGDGQQWLERVAGRAK